MTRLFLLVAATAAALAAVAQPVAAATPAPALAELRAATAFEQVYVTSTGERVRIAVSDQLVPNEEENQAWAEFLARLPHGAELARMTLYIAPVPEVRQICGRTTLACYLGAPQRIVFPSEATPGQPTREAILAHEYGHHLARNRNNAPWPALLYGTKRWATHAGVCPGLRSGRLSVEQYTISPAEVFAETYRVLAETRLGLEPTPWQVVDPRFQPDARALSLLERDIVDPWQRPTVVQRRASRTHTFRFVTPLDGRIVFTLRGPRTAVYELRVPGARPLRVTGRGPARVIGGVCGTRQARATVRRIQGSGRYQLAVSRP